MARRFLVPLGGVVVVWAPLAAEPIDISAILRPLREQHDMPAMAGAVVTSRGLDAVGWTGWRKRGHTAQVAGDDLWHLGSCTKAMTAAIVGKLVEDGKVRWDTTVSEVFPDLAADFHAGYRGVTVVQLLSHRAGLAKDLKWREFAGAEDLPGKRRAVLRRAFGAKPTYPPDNDAQYSNVGYIVIGATVEKLTGREWEAVIREWIFAPLGMSGAGFGGLGTAGVVDQPWGHSADGTPVPKNGSSNDNLPVMGPAGRVHCTIQDWAKFVAEELRGARGIDGLLKAATHAIMKKPQRGGEMAMGWMVLERPWGGGSVLHHTGSNTMYYCNVWMAPARDFAVLVCVNQGGDKAFRATDQAAGALIRWAIQRAEGKAQR